MSIIYRESIPRKKNEERGRDKVKCAGRTCTICNNNDRNEYAKKCPGSSPRGTCDGNAVAAAAVDIIQKLFSL